MPLDPHNLMAHVEPELVKVIQKAIQQPQPFQVVYGIRTREAETEAVKSGHSTTMHSRHLPDRNGLAAAVDVVAIIDGKIDWAPGREAEVFGRIATSIKAAANSLNIPIEWGGDWETFKDWGHFQLPWNKYP